MPGVTVKLIYTPRPEGNETTVRVGGGDYYPIKFDSEYGSGEVLAAVPLNTTAAEAIDVANALVLVAGCADTRWRGWRWEAREANGQLLATTPVGEWYANSYDCITAIGTLFGTESVVLLDDQYHGNVTVREPQTVSVKALDEIRTVATNWATQDTDYDEDTEQQIDDGKAIIRILTRHGLTTTPDADPDEYPVGKVEL